MNRQPSGDVRKRVVEANGATLHLTERGDGAPLILLHGGLFTSAHWEPVAQRLAGEFRVITPDSRGHGRSTNPAGVLSYALIADDVAALIDSLGLERPLVGGWSDGGQVALELAARHPGTAAALVVGAAYPEFESSGLRDAHRALLAADEAGVPDIARLDAQLGEFAEPIRALHPRGPDQWGALVGQTAAMWLEYEGLNDDRVAALHEPCLVLGGDRDELVSLGLTLALYEALTEAELAICPGLGHDGPTRERAPLFAALIGDFARRRGPS